MPRYKVTLTEEERKELTKNYTKGKHSAHAVLSARALVLLDAGDGGPAKSNKEVSEATGLSLRTIGNLKRTFVEEGIEAVLDRRKRETPPRHVVFDGRFAAELTRLACSECPQGHARWTVRLLRDKLVELGIVESVSAMTVCSTLKKTRLSLISANTGRSRRTRAASS
ncbi:MAG: helix-turn-helix domain-containing protein [Oligosphaeraceae bacterium]